MGSNGSKIVKKILSPASNKDSRKKCDLPTYYLDEDRRTHQTIAKVPQHIGPLVMYRQGSMYFDEDGDLAHEFYTEVKEGRKSKMRRVYENLKPQGSVKLPFPRLHNDCPVIIYVL